MYRRFMDWLVKGMREDFGFFLPILSFILGIFIFSSYDALLMAFPSWRLAIMFTIPMLLFFSLPFIYILGEASKEAARLNEVRDIVMKCLEQLREIEAGLEPGQCYKLADGYAYPHSLRDASELLEKALGKGCVGVSPMSFGFERQHYEIHLSHFEDSCTQELLT